MFIFVSRLMISELNNSQVHQNLFHQFFSFSELVKQFLDPTVGTMIQLLLLFFKYLSLKW